MVIWLLSVGIEPTPPPLPRHVSGAKRCGEPPYRSRTTGRIPPRQHIHKGVDCFGSTLIRTDRRPDCTHTHRPHNPLTPFSPLPRARCNKETTRSMVLDSSPHGLSGAAIYLSCTRRRHAQPCFCCARYRTDSMEMTRPLKSTLREFPYRYGRTSQIEISRSTVLHTLDCFSDNHRTHRR